MIANTNDGSQARPYLRRDLSMATLFGLPAGSLGPDPSHPHAFEVIRKAGYSGVQLLELPVPPNTVGLAMTGFGRTRNADDVHAIARKHQAAGLQCTTLQLGSGIEDDDTAYGLIERLLNTSEALCYPLYLETHRGTITQDIWRTCRYVEKFPELRFNGDLSHWYTGHEMANGDFVETLTYMRPVLERVRFLHGRISDAGCIQVALAHRMKEPYVEHFKRLWTEVFTHFLRSAAGGDFISFAVELLPSKLLYEGKTLHIGYARDVQRDDGTFHEESDRWHEAELVWQVASDCFASARKLQLPAGPRSPGAT
jgi:hypothetical protein